MGRPEADSNVLACGARLPHVNLDRQRPPTAARRKLLNCSADSLGPGRVQGWESVCLWFLGFMLLFVLFYVLYVFYVFIVLWFYVFHFVVVLVHWFQKSTTYPFHDC